MSIVQDGTRRPVIGVMTGSFHTDYSRQITDAICRHLRLENMEPCLFQGLDASRFLKIEGYVDKSFDDHYYTQFEYSRFVRPDLIIASVSTISAVRNPLPAVDFRAILPDVPVIALEIEDEIPNGVHIFLDNYKGMVDCVEHLIADHGCRKIFYVSGPKGVADAEKRLCAYRDTMRAHGLDVTEDMVLYGDFTDHIDPLLERLLTVCPHPDAIVCANDEMAESAYRVLSAHGLRPGVDVAVTGFDDNAAAALMNPPLTTVRQSMEQIAEKVIEIIRAYLRGEHPASIMLPTELILRQSCGCSGTTFQVERPVCLKLNQAMEDRQTIKRISHDCMLVSLMLRNLLNQSITVHAFFRKLGAVLDQLNTTYSWIALLDEPMTVKENERFHLPDHLRLHMLQRRGAVQSWSRRDAPKLTPDATELIESLRPAPADDDRQMALFPLFYADIHYGVFAVRLSMVDMLAYYTLSLQIGTGLKYLFTAISEQEARVALEEKNQILDFSASHDGLTGLYNRIGVMRQIYDYIHTHGQNQSYVAVMADLDHLKQINDTFGHGMGDHAIRKAAEILSHSLSKDAPLGRSGGDEFMAIFRAETDDAAARFYQGVKEGCRAYNALMETPFYEEISVGCYSFVLHNGDDIREFFAKADEMLYADKRQRRACVIRCAD